MKNLRKKVYMTAGYNTISLGTGRKEFSPKKPRPGVEHYIKEAGQGVLKQIGGAKVSEVHANFIVNTGEASASDIIKLKDFVAKSVKDKFGVTLDTEVFFIGED